MEEILGSSIDRKNIELAKTLFSLRHDLDVHCLIGVNASQLNQNRPGKFFFGHISMRSLESIILAICKVYEDEKRNELNSIQGVLNSLSAQTPALQADQKDVRSFISQYGGPSEAIELLTALQKTFDQFKARHATDIDRFKRARDKIVAHSEFRAMRDPLPSFDVMEKNFSFSVPSFTRS